METNIRKDYSISDKMVALIEKTNALKSEISKILNEEEKRLKELDLWAVKESQPYNHLLEAYWNCVDVINGEIEFAAETVKTDILDELVNKLT